MTTITVDAEPYEYEFEPDKTALMVVDMQRDFIEEGGFGDSLGNDVSRLQAAVGPTKTVLERAREIGMQVIHTREGHRPDLEDAPETKIERGNISPKIGEEGPMGRLPVRGEEGHEIVPELQPEGDEPVVDKPGKDSFYQTDLELIFENNDIENIIICGVTAEVCVQSTVREANDRGYECLVLRDCIASYFPEFHEATVNMIKAQGGIFGWVSDSETLLSAVEDL